MKVLEPNLERLLVVLDEEDLDIAGPLLQRTRQVAEALAGGAQVELFYVESELGAARRLFSREDEEELSETCARQAKAIADRLQTLTRALESDRVRVASHVVRAHSYVDGLLDKIQAARPDVVLKRSSDHRFVIGVASHSDWELLRSSTSHVWFVGDNRRPPKRILSAVGSLDVAEDVISATDYDIFAVAKLVAAALDAENRPVHAFQSLQGIGGYPPYTRGLDGLNYPTRELPSISEIRRAIAHEHGRLIRAFAEYFGLDPSSVCLAEGHPADVLPRTAGDIGADLIVMGARNLTRWQRVVRSVTAEAVLGKVTCDVLVVKDARERAADRAVDVEQAIIDPEQVFETPAAVAQAGELSIALRRRILDAWHQDAEAMLRMEAEGGIEDDFDASIIPEIDRVRRQLASAESK